MIPIPKETIMLTAPYLPERMAHESKASIPNLSPNEFIPSTLHIPNHTRTCTPRSSRHFRIPIHHHGEHYLAIYSGNQPTYLSTVVNPITNSSPIRSHPLFSLMIPSAISSLPNPVGDSYRVYILTKYEAHSPTLSNSNSSSIHALHSGSSIPGSKYGTESTTSSNVRVQYRQPGPPPTNQKPTLCSYFIPTLQGIPSSQPSPTPQHKLLSQSISQLQKPAHRSIRRVMYSRITCTVNGTHPWTSGSQPAPPSLIPRISHTRDAREGMPNADRLLNTQYGRPAKTRSCLPISSTVWYLV
ncbi:uncharacterized protein EI97DRAFT_438096 [Westerdykella ornata]|uniref:Uncharacterized protein n=1 Tax=Westerdykella ornata TaxID=318751 RepID=A0A6A6JWP8_WESOR|nr:uncharacterized protein EI97DRAFT_438096 [Westerdykella ornata]KAF2280624.1 hypothetical protein EI97DRAFT_438096 [Westerdykella ornata]